jgi:hypothetical protein
MTKKVLIVFAFVFLLAGLVDVQGQYFSRRKQYSSIGGGLCAMNYFGDIVPKSGVGSFDLSFTRPQLSFAFVRKFHPRFSVKGTFSWGRLQGDDFSSADPTDDEAKFRYARNLHFRNDIKEIAVVGIVDLFENRGTFNKRPPLNPYLFAGIGFIHHNPKARTPDDLGGAWVALQPLNTEEKSYSRVQPVLPIGLGLRYRINQNFDIAFEMGYRYTFTDYLDDVGGLYKDLDKFDDPIAARMSNRTGESVSAFKGVERDFGVIQAQYGGVETVQSAGTSFDIARGVDEGEVRGNSGDNDLYIVYGFHVTYILYKGMRSPKFR